MRVLVTGARGFVGRRLVGRLEARGDDVTGVDREVDVSDAGAVDACVASTDPEAVIHLAAQSFVPASWSEPKLTYHVNFIGTRALLEAVQRRAPRARILAVSTSAVYGCSAPDSAPADEQSPLRPASPYACTKAAADLLAGHYARRGLDVLRVRPFNHTGPGQSDRFAASSFARQIAEIELGRREPRLRVGNLDSRREFLDVDDVIEAYLRLLDPSAPAGIYNVASGRGRPVREVLELLLACARVRPAVEVDRALFRPTDALVGSAEKLRRATGWTPRVPLGDTLGRLLDAWRAELSAA